MEKETLPSFIKNVSNHELYGRTYEVLLPCGSKVTLREQNGNDDDVISSFNKGEVESTSFNRFVAGLVVDNNFPFVKTPGKSLSVKEVLQMPLNSKYFIIMVSRIFSLGEMLYFEWDWKDGNKPVPYEDDLTQYLWDYEITFPEPGDPIYNKERIKPYTITKDSEGNIEYHRQFTLKTGKTIKYDLLNGHGENYLLKLPVDKRTANSTIKARNTCLWVEEKGDWVKIENFKFFTPREMAEIRAGILDTDPSFEGLTTIENPVNGESSQLPLLHIPDFFFPREI